MTKEEGAYLGGPFQPPSFDPEGKIFPDWRNWITELNPNIIWLLPQKITDQTSANTIVAGDLDKGLGERSKVMFIYRPESTPDREGYSIEAGYAYANKIPIRVLNERQGLAHTLLAGIAQRWINDFTTEKRYISKYISLLNDLTNDFRAATSIV